MNTSAIKILLLEATGKSESILQQMLNSKGYKTESLTKIEPAIEMIMNHTVDLVISENNVNSHNGFAVFKILMKYLRNSCIPFFLVLDNFEKEDMLIGLEIGIDNFIISPINSDSVCYKIENQLGKRNDLDIFHSVNFKEYFHCSSVAMFYVENNRIDVVNEAFYKLNNGCAKDIMEMTIDTIFNFAENKQNEMNYRRFQNGIIQSCKLFNVSCHKNPAYFFDISFYRGKNENAPNIFAEMIPSVFAETIDIHNKTVINRNAKHFKENDTDTKKEEKENIKLTSREQQVFDLSASGLPIKVIANQLNLSERTVEKHRANIMTKAKAKNIIEAIIRVHHNNALIQAV